MKKLIFLFIMMFFSFLSVNAQETINVAFCIDKNYVIYTCLTINSIIINNKSNSNYQFYIINNDLSDRDKILMTNYIHKKGQNIDFIDISNNDIPSFYDVAPRVFHVANIALSRIILSELLPNVDKIIYLDGDLLVVSDLKELFDIPLEHQYVFGMAENSFNAWKTQYRNIDNKNQNYYNSGVILMDLEKMRENNISLELISYLNDNIELFQYDINNNKKFTFLFPDQDLINFVIGDKIKTIPQKWNNQIVPNLYIGPGYEAKKMIIEDYNNYGGILHYTGICKPWNFMDGKKLKSHKLYLKYWEKSGLYKYIFKDIIKCLKNYYLDFYYRIIGYNKIKLKIY